MKLGFHPQGKYCWFALVRKFVVLTFSVSFTKVYFNNQVFFLKVVNFPPKVFFTVTPVKSQIKVARSFNTFLVLLFFVQLFFLLLTHSTSTYADNQYLRTKHLLTHITTTYAQNLCLRA